MPFATDRDFLQQWEQVLADRVDLAVSALADTAGVRGVILGGSLAVGQAWPLADIDLVLLIDDRQATRARTAIDLLRRRFMASWEAEGWPTSLESGGLIFGVGEVETILRASPAGQLAMLAEPRLYQTFEKGYQAKVRYDPDGQAQRLVDWFEQIRHEPTVLAFRRELGHRWLLEQHSALLAAIVNAYPWRGTIALRDGISTAQSLLIEQAGEPGGSPAHRMTRCEQLAQRYGYADLAATLAELAALDEQHVRYRLEAAPEWVRQRHQRSWQARLYVNDTITALQDARDVLNVASQQALREASPPILPDWLAVPRDAQALIEPASRFWQVINDERLVPAGDA